MPIVSDAELAELRADALSELTSRATIRRKGAPVTVGKFTVPGWDTVGTDVPFRLEGSPSGAGSWKASELTDAKVVDASRVGKLPHDWTDLKDDDFIEITAGENTAVVVRVIEATWQDRDTSRRFPVVTVPRPKEWTP